MLDARGSWGGGQRAVGRGQRAGRRDRCSHVGAQTLLSPLANGSRLRQRIPREQAYWGRLYSSRSRGYFQQLFLAILANGGIRNSKTAIEKRKSEIRNGNVNDEWGERRGGVRKTAGQARAAGRIKRAALPEGIAAGRSVERCLQIFSQSPTRLSQRQNKWRAYRDNRVGDCESCGWRGIAAQIPFC